MMIRKPDWLFTGIIGTDIGTAQDPRRSSSVPSSGDITESTTDRPIHLVPNDVEVQRVFGDDAKDCMIQTVRHGEEYGGPFLEGHFFNASVGVLLHTARMYTFSSCFYE